jgi:hypothetical protein
MARNLKNQPLNLNPVFTDDILFHEYLLDPTLTVVRRDYDPLWFLHPESEPFNPLPLNTPIRASGVRKNPHREVSAPQS